MGTRGDPRRAIAGQTGAGGQPAAGRARRAVGAPGGRGPSLMALLLQRARRAAGRGAAGLAWHRRRPTAAELAGLEQRPNLGPVVGTAGRAGVRAAIG